MRDKQSVFVGSIFIVDKIVELKKKKHTSFFD